MQLYTVGGDPQVVRIITGHFHALPEYGTYREEGTTSWLLVLTLDGAGHFGDLIAHPGDLVLIRPHTLHDYGTAPGSDRWELVWAHFHPWPHWAQWLRGPSTHHFSLEQDRDYPRIRDRMHEAHQSAIASGVSQDELAMNAIEEVLIRVAARSHRHATIDDRIRLVVDAVLKNLKRPHSIATLADLATLSESRLSHLFKEEMGVTIQRFIEDQRIHRARRLLELTSLSVGEIAEESGFPNVYYFSNRFKKATGLSPTGYRATPQ